jgi:subtilisin-like proprotein convertase family protein
MTLRFAAQNLPLTVVDGQTREISIPVNLPMDAIVNDVDVRVKITGDAFYNNLLIQAESPSSTIATLWNQLGGCAPAPIWVQFDDEASPLQTCENYSTDKDAQIPIGLGLLSSFDNENVNGIWKVRVSDVAGFGDVSTIQNIELKITMSGVFGAGLPNGLTAQQVTQNGFQSYSVPAGLLDPCSNVTLTYIDETTPKDCSTGLKATILRRWSAKDGSGNMSTCFQQIDLLRPTLRDVVLPPDYDGIDAQFFDDCAGIYPTADYIESLGLQGYPYIFNMIDGCNTIQTEYEDKAVWTCDGAYNINREWSIIDNCTGQFIQHTQIIRVVDNTGPVFIDPPAVDIVKTTDPYDCCSSMELPDVMIADECSRVSSVQALVITKDPFTGLTTNIIAVNGGLYNFPGNPANDPDTLASFALTPCIPVGDHIVRYIATDACGNTSTYEFNLSVVDYSPPTAACDETTVVAMGKDDPNDCYYANFANCEFAGVTWTHATTFDDGSFDQCSNVKFTIRRAAPYSECINALDQSPCPGNDGGLSEFDLATVESDSIKFYCCEVGTELMVILRVYQLNPDGTISNYLDGTPIYNECQINVKVQDKLKPICDAPFSVTVNCENFDPSLWTYGKPAIYDNCCLDTSYHYQGQKGLTHSVNYNNFDTICNKGTIVRTFRAFDCHGASSVCTQRIVVNYEQDYFIKFPDDATVTVCDGTGMFGEPKFFGEDCELLGVSFQDQIYTVVPDA